MPLRTYWLLIDLTLWMLCSIIYFGQIFYLLLGVTWIRLWWIVVLTDDPEFESASHMHPFFDEFLVPEAERSVTFRIFSEPCRADLSNEKSLPPSLFGTMAAVQLWMTRCLLLAFSKRCTFREIS